MHKRFQFFISSTFTDLKEERQSVLKAVLDLDHMPAGMELFPASDESSWQLIQDVIDASDYYLLIVGGRYGSVDEEGLSYTEKEYDYAVQTKKPVLAFLHENPDELPRHNTETDDTTWKKLQEFRAKLQRNHTLVMWTSAEDLKSKVIVSITGTIKRRPAIGWVRADQVPSGGTIAEVLTLRNRVTELEVQLQEASLSPPQGTEDFEQGDDPVSIDGEYDVGSHRISFASATYHVSIPLTWNEIFSGVAPTMISEASAIDLHAAFRSFFEQRGRSAVETTANQHILEFRFRNDQIETCIVQLRTLGLIRESVRQRSVKDTNTYWRLTPWGDHLMTTLRAVRKRTK